MKRRIGILFLMLITLTGICFAAYPADWEEQELQNLASNEEHTEDLIEPISMYPDSDKEDTSNIVESDLFLSESNATITEVVNGNVYVMAKNLKMDGAIIYGNLYLMAEDVDISNVEINGSVYVMGEKVHFSGTAYDIYAFGEQIDLDLEAYIWRDAKIYGNKVNLNGNIYRNATIGVNQLLVADRTVIGGTLEYYSQNEVSVPEEAQIGNVEFHKETPKVESKNYVFEIATIAFKTLMISLLLIFVITKFRNLNRTENIAIDFLKDTGKGIITFFVFPVLAVVLIVTEIGSALGVMTIFLYIILLYVSNAFTSVEIANRILSKLKTEDHKNAKLIGISILVSIIIWGLSLVPVLKLIIPILTGLIGLGILASLVVEKKKKEPVQDEN